MLTDTHHNMIISQQQVELALRYLQTTSQECEAASPCEVAPELLDRVREALAGMPDCREDRVVEARDRFAVGVPSSEEIAEKMLGRIISDSIR